VIIAQQTQDVYGVEDQKDVIQVMLNIPHAHNHVLMDGSMVRELVQIKSEQEHFQILPQKY
jgi:hypothetical protein